MQIGVPDFAGFFSMSKDNKLKTLPKDYRYLKVGEKIKQGDLFWSESKKEWKKILYPDDTTSWVANQIIRNEYNESK